MIPYGSLLFFYILILLLIPAVVLGLCGIKIKIYGIIVNFLMLIILFGTSKSQILYLLMFYLGELILVKTYVIIRKKYKQRWILRVFILFSILPLFLVKISHYITVRQIGFLGISYLTFKCIQILIETYDGLINQVKILDFTYFILFFPTISSGPIDRSRRFLNDTDNKLTKEEYIVLIKGGAWRLFLGLSYKFIFGALINNLWLTKIPVNHSFLNTMNYMYAYSLYLFFDFAGYSFIAAGTSYFLGVKTPDNFNKPFISKDIKEFWNRWHMSLSFWFRDFIYTRFVMTAMKKKWFKSRYTSSYIGYFITMLTMGLWHGSQIYYIIYGLYHGTLIVLTDIFQRKSKWYKRNKNNPIWQLIFIIINIQIVAFGFLIFSGYMFK